MEKEQIECVGGPLAGQVVHVNEGLEVFYAEAAQDQQGRTKVEYRRQTFVVDGARVDKLVCQSEQG